MKFVLPLLIAIAVCSAGVIEDPTKGYQEGDRFFYFPGDGDGILHLVDAEEPVDTGFIVQYARNPDNNAYWLFTRNNPFDAQILTFGDEQSVYRSFFDRSKITVFLAHGWNGAGSNTMNTMLTQAFLEDADVNVIVLDWSRLANRSYTTARSGVEAVGRGLGQFIVWLTGNFEVTYERIHLVGFSLGGHIVGNAGKETGGRIKRITALDPAGPLFFSSSSDRVTPSDGQYVEVMHTNTNLYGYSGVCGDADFYPNGGGSMPGCWLNTCSHSKAYEYFASSIRNNNLLANECDTQRDAERNRCSGALHPMGNSDIQKSRPGVYRVNTARSYPF